MIQSNEVGDEELEIDATIEHFVDVFRCFIIVEIKLSNVLVLQTFFVGEPFTEILDPNILSKEDSARPLFKLFVEGNQDRVLNELVEINGLHEVLH